MRREYARKKNPQNYFPDCFDRCSAGSDPFKLFFHLIGGRKIVAIEKGEKHKNIPLEF